MPITDDRTSHLDLPLPHVDNNLTADIPRLREALTDIDAKFAALDTLLGSDDVTLDAIQELVDAIKDNAGDITSILSSKADQTALDALKVEHEEVQTLTAGSTVVDLAVLTNTAGCTVYIDGIRLNAVDWTPHVSIVTRLTLGAAYGSDKTITVVRRQGGA